MPSYLLSAYDLKISVFSVTNYEESEKKETFTLCGHLANISVITTTESSIDVKKYPSMFINFKTCDLGWICPF